MMLLKNKLFEFFLLFSDLFSEDGYFCVIHFFLDFVFFFFSLHLFFYFRCFFLKFFKSNFLFFISFYNKNNVFYLWKLDRNFQENYSFIKIQNKKIEYSE